jgi:hypothetical protein
MLILSSWLELAVGLGAGMGLGIILWTVDALMDADVRGNDDRD